MSRNLLGKGIVAEAVVVQLLARDEDPTMTRVRQVQGVLRKHPRRDLLDDAARIVAIDEAIDQMREDDPAWALKEVQLRGGKGSVFLAARTVEWREQILDDKDGIIVQGATLESAKAAMEAALAERLAMREECKALTNADGVQVLARVLTRGSRYGLHDALVFDNDVPSVEFFDGRGSNSPRGYMIGRYHLDSLERRRDDPIKEGIMLEGGDIDYVLTGEELRVFVDWAADLAPKQQRAYSMREGATVRHAGPLYIEGYDADEGPPQQHEPYIRIAKPGQLLERVLQLQQQCIDEDTRRCSGYGLDVLVTVGSYEYEAPCLLEVTAHTYALKPTLPDDSVETRPNSISKLEQLLNGPAALRITGLDYMRKGDSTFIAGDSGVGEFAQAVETHEAFLAPKRATPEVESDSPTS